MRPIRNLLCSAALAALTAAGPAAAETLAVVHAHIHSLGKAGEIASGTVLIEDGRIAAVGADVKVPAGARVIDAHGRSLARLTQGREGVIDARLPAPLPRKTLFRRLGDLPFLALVLISTLIMGFRVLEKSRNRAQDAHRGVT